MTDDLASDVATRVQAGDPVAAEQLDAWFRPRLLTFVRARTGDPDLAQDVAQEVLMAVIRALQNGQVREAAHLPAFVFGVARNLLVTALRRKSRARETSLEAARDVQVPPTDIVARDARARLYAAIDELDDVDRRILRLTLLEGFGPAEIALRLGMSHDVVRQRKSRAMRKLTQRIESPSRTTTVVRPSTRPALKGAG